MITMPKKENNHVEEESDELEELHEEEVAENAIHEVEEEPTPEEAPKKKFMYEKLGAQFSDAE
jgi:hypothetical protein